MFTDQNKVTHLLVIERKPLPQWRMLTMPKEEKALLQFLLQHGSPIEEEARRLYEHNVRWTHSISLTWPDSRDAPFDFRKAQQTAYKILNHFNNLQIVWMCGANVIRAFGFKDKKYGIRCQRRIHTWDLILRSDGYLPENHTGPLLVGVPYPSRTNSIWFSEQKKQEIKSMCLDAYYLTRSPQQFEFVNPC